MSTKLRNREQGEKDYNNRWQDRSNMQQAEQLENDHCLQKDSASNWRTMNFAMLLQ
jgi:hypothetical protein